MYSWGRGTFGRLGSGSESDLLLPTRIRFFEENKLKIVGIAAGAYHNLALAGSFIFKIDYTSFIIYLRLLCFISY